MIRVMLVDDHPVVRSGYHRLLEQAGDIAVVAEAGEAESAYAAYLQHQPDVCVTDLSMPGAGGLELTRKILQREPRARVLVFSMHDTPQMVQRALDAGAMGFVSKNASPDSLLLAVHTVLSGQRYLSPDLPVSLLQAEASSDADRLKSLGPREFEIFRLLAQGHSPADCASALHLSPKTVANNQTQIKEKLGVGTSAALVHLALRNGVIGPNGQ